MITRNVFKACQKSKKVMAVNKFMNAVMSPAFAEIENENKIVNKIIMNYDLFETLDSCGQFLIYEGTASLWTADVIFDDSYDINKFTLKYQEDLVETGCRDFTFDFDKFFGAKKDNHKINKNKYNHNWIERGTCVAPFKCSKCGALSGSNRAVSECPCRDQVEDIDKYFLEKATKDWLSSNFEQVSRIAESKNITFRSALFYVIGFKCVESILEESD